MNKQEHIEWCQRRAYEYINRGELGKAWTSFSSDMKKHEETRSHSALLLGSQMLFSGMLNDREGMRRFIDGFN